MKSEAEKIAGLKLVGCAYCMQGYVDLVTIICICRLSNKEVSLLGCCDKFDEKGFKQC